MGPALTQAARLFSQLPANQQRDRILVIVTDGQVSGEDAILRQLASETAGRLPRIFTVGIDQAVNAGFLQRLADDGRGACELVESEDRLDAAMDRIRRLIGTPVLTNVRLEPVNFDCVSTSLAPERIADLFVDRPVTIFARHLVSDAPLQLRVHATDAQGQPWTQEIVGRAAAGPMLLSMWGRAKVRDLEDQYASGLARDASALMQQIVNVSLESHVLSRFTAYVAVDRAEIVNAGGQQQHILQPVEAPAGWQEAGAAMCFSRMAFGEHDGILSKAKRVIGRALGNSFSSYRESRRMRSAPASQPNSAQADDELGSVDSDLMKSIDSLCQEQTQPASINLCDAEALAEGAPARTFLNMILHEAIKDGASEIRFEAFPHEVRVTRIVSGQALEYVPPPRALWDDIIRRIQVMANLDLDERNRTQTGRIELTVGGHQVVLEVTTTPATYGPLLIIKLETPPKADVNSSRRKSRKQFWK
jgi:hypothetical protein